ncbi:MAG: hypothetical protein JZU65_05640 [Chlorobium sp.]|nr:hypothetical protein [Chlorobium sp.]
MVLVLSPNGEYTKLATLEEARTSAFVAGKTVVVTTPQVVTTAIAWPGDRVLKFEGGGYVTFSGAGTLTGLKESRPQWFNAKGDGTTDDTAALQATFNAATPGVGGTIPVHPWAAEVFFPPGNYKITNTLNVPRGISIKGTNARTHSGCTIQQVTSDEFIFDLYGVLYDTNRRTADQKISGFKFISAGGAIRAMSTDYPGITMSIGSLTITDNHFINIDGGYAIYTDAHIENVSNNTFDYCAIGHIKAGGGRITNNMFFEATSGAIVIDTDYLPTDYGYVPTIIATNEFIGNGSASSTDPLKAAVAFIGSSTIYSTLITGNTFSGLSTGAGSVGIQSSVNVGFIGLNLSNNVFSQLAGNAISLSHVKYSNISNNVVASCGNTVLGTNVMNFVTDSIGNSLVNNSFYNNGGSYNIAFGGTSSDNSISQTKQDVYRVSLPTGTATMADYSEGVFTPQVTFGDVNVSTTPSDCKYVRMGKSVNMSCSVAFNRGTQTGTMKILGFPFTLVGLNRLDIISGITIPTGYSGMFFNGSDTTCYFCGPSGPATVNESNVTTGTLQINFNGIL